MSNTAPCLCRDKYHAFFNDTQDSRCWETEVHVYTLRFLCKRCTCIYIDYTHIHVHENSCIKHTKDTCILCMLYRTPPEVCSFQPVSLEGRVAVAWWECGVCSVGRPLESLRVSLLHVHTWRWHTCIHMRSMWDACAYYAVVSPAIFS